MNYTELLIELAPTIVGGILTLIGAAAGALFSKAKERQAAKRSEVVNCYASFLQAYTEYTALHSIENRGRVIYALEVARLVCSEKSADLFAQFEKSFLEDPNDFASRKKTLNEIRKQGVKEMAKL